MLKFTEGSCVSRSREEALKALPFTAEKPSNFILYSYIKIFIYFYNP